MFFCEQCECESVEHVLWECSEYSSIRKEFIKNLDGFLQYDFHLKSSFDKTKFIFDQGIWECNGHFDDWFSNTKAFLCGIWNLRREKLYPSGSSDLVLHSSMHQSMRGQWQRCYGSAFMRYLFIYLFIYICYYKCTLGNYKLNLLSYSDSVVILHLRLNFQSLKHMIKIMQAAMSLYTACVMHTYKRCS